MKPRMLTVNLIEDKSGAINLVFCFTQVGKKLSIRNHLIQIKPGDNVESIVQAIHDFAHRISIDGRLQVDYITLVGDSKCPACGDFVILPAKPIRDSLGGDIGRNNPLVFCSDMGHWKGHLSECIK